MNMKPLSVLKPPCNYHDWSTRKTFWEERFIGEGKLTPGEFTAVNMKNCGWRKIRKHREIKYNDKYITLEISLKFGGME